ncbi:ankyrin repeat protein [Histomonas meleagridis]|uniref:ankyrin repeat protein n=1 Tax=Histomonas meleagridis TaxID=135588 RepID=UPI00355A1B0D|nr:ankyrin repeat protein [Histomonas meleagridis]KAH0804219.1 ankyrin repeat protein [Histomonas meleagridis]
MKQHRRFSVTMLCWFLPEIEQDDLDLFSKYKNLLEESHKSPYFKDLANVNIPFIQQFDKLKENNWKLYREYRDIGMNPDPIAMAISDDAVIDYGDVNSTIEPSMFECCGFINHYPTLIQYAAFCGSVNAFFYLQRKNADFSKLDRKNRRLEEYAIAGGNSEIITSVFQSETHISSTPLQENQTRHAPISARRRKIMDIAAERTFSGCRGRVMQPSNFRVQDSPVFATIGTKSDSNSGYSNLTVAKFNRYGVIPPQVDESVFLKACSSDCIKLVIYGIENGIDPNCVDKNNQSGVTLAAINGNVDILRFLSTLEGVNLSVMDNVSFIPSIFHFNFLVFFSYCWYAFNTCIRIWKFIMCKSSSKFEIC